jgi:hypothetical protein
LSEERRRRLEIEQVRAVVGPTVTNGVMSRLEVTNGDGGVSEINMIETYRRGWRQPVDKLMERSRREED